jgi:hypothetical protein
MVCAPVLEPCGSSQDDEHLTSAGALVALLPSSCCPGDGQRRCLDSISLKAMASGPHDSSAHERIPHQLGIADGFRVDLVVSAASRKARLSARSATTALIAGMPWPVPV